MAELSGSLAVIGIAPLLHFLSELSWTGDLLVSRSNWIGQLSLDRGRLTAAVVEDEHGVAALEFIATYLHCAEFELFVGPPSLTPNLTSSTDARTPLEQLAFSLPGQWVSHLPEPGSVPR